jgi:hypothetical protein
VPSALPRISQIRCSGTAVICIVKFLLLLAVAVPVVCLGVDRRRCSASVFSGGTATRQLPLEPAEHTMASHHEGQVDEQRGGEQPSSRPR